MILKELDKYDVITQRHLASAAPLLAYIANNDAMLKMHKSTAKTRLILGGKRSGKSTWGVVEVCWAALGIHPYLDYPSPPLKIRVCTVDLNNGVHGILLPMFKQWLPPGSIQDYLKEKNILILTNGTEIDFKSFEQDIDKFEGVERHLVWMDEEPPKEIYESNFMRTVSSGINGKLILTMTPLYGLTWIYDQLYDNPKAIPPAVEHTVVSIFDNPHVNREAIESIKSDPAMRDSLESVMYGRFVPKSGLIYKAFDPVKHIIPPFKPSPDWMIVIGIDPHDRNPHGVVFCALTQDSTWLVFDEVFEQCLISELVTKIKAKLKERFPPALAIIDTSAHAPQSISGRSVADELLKYGIGTIPAFKDLSPGILKVNELLEPGIMKLPNGKVISGKPKLYVADNCYNLIREFRHYVWDEWAHRKGKYDPKERPLKRDDHLMDALRYVMMANIVYRHPGFKRVEPNITGRISPVTGYF